MTSGTPPTPGPPRLPVSVRSRRTLAGWQQWRKDRDTFVPAERKTEDEYDALDHRERVVYDWHRRLTSSNLPFSETPMTSAVARLLHARIWNNASNTVSTTLPGWIVNGGGFQGKTETVCSAVAKFEDEWRDLHDIQNPDAIAGTRDLFVPVAYVQTPVTARPPSLIQTVPDFYGANYAGMSLPRLESLLCSSFEDHGTKVLVLDDLTRLKLHRKDDMNTLDTIKGFMEMGVTVIGMGVDVYNSGLLAEGRAKRDEQHRNPVPGRTPRARDAEATQLERRLHPIDLDPFSYKSPDDIRAWVTHLAGVEDALRLLRAEPGMLTDGDMPEYLHDRTGGVLGLLALLIKLASQVAIISGETIRTLEATSWAAFNAAIERIHADLASVTGLVDYGRRRQAMWSWRLSDDQWSALLDDRILLGWMRPDTRYRFYADVRIWCRVTQGLHLYSPMFRTMRRGSAAPLYTMLNSPAAQAKNHVLLDALHPRIERLADSIAAAIDAGLMV